MNNSEPVGNVALFAPEICPSWGGVWQFYQWVLRWVGPRQPFFLVAPVLMLEQIANSGIEGTRSIPFEDFISSVKATAAYRILEEQRYSRIGPMRIPLYGRVAWRVKRRFFNGDLIGNAFRNRLEQEKVELLHIPLQQFHLRGLVGRFPYVINPHDFQHEHFPEFFTAENLQWRRKVWYKDQREASAVVVHSRQTQADAIRYLGIPEERVFYAPYGPLDTFPEPDEDGLYQTKRDLSLPDRFIFYPARSWPHKNHLALVEAIYHLKQRGVEVNAVFTTVVDEHGKLVRERIAERNLGQQVTIVGRVSPEQMGALYRLCTVVVVPSLFEQNSGPMLEAINFGKPVAVSHLDELAQTLNGAGELFDPRSVMEIAEAIDRLWSSDAALAEAEAIIIERRASLSWEPFREVYRRAYEYALGHPVGIFNRGR